MTGKPQVLPTLWLVFAALLGGVILSYPFFLLFATASMAGAVSTAAGLWAPALLAVALLALAVAWLRRSAGHRRLHSAFLLGGVLGGTLWFSLFLSRPV